MQKKIAIVYPWPGRQTSELELMHRVRKITADMGFSVTYLSPTGQILDDAGLHLAVHPGTPSPETAEQWDLLLYLHFATPKVLDGFALCTNWNPVAFLLAHPTTGYALPPSQVSYHAACLESMDVLLSATSDTVDGFAKALNAILASSVIPQEAPLHTTCQRWDQLNFPTLTDPSIFFISANWERQYKAERHASLIEILDMMGCVQFYGIRRHNGVFIWEGIQNYVGELPFDGGESIIRESNRCGISLVLHSPAHHREGVVSTRIFQACAAKTVVIADDNPWISRNFGDAVLTFDYNPGKITETARQIQAHFEWIRNNPEAALEKARAANKIFLQRFCLEVELGRLADRLPDIQETHKRMLGPLSAETVVDIVWRFCPRTVAAFIEDMHHQHLVQLRVLVYVTQTEQVDATKTLGGVSFEHVLHVIPERTTLGEIVFMALQRHLRADMFAVYQRSTRWLSHHLGFLVRMIEDGARIAHSGTFVRNLKFRDSKLSDYSKLLECSIGTRPRGISLKQIRAFDVASIMASACLFHRGTMLKFGDSLQALPLYGSSFCMHLIALHYEVSGHLPAFTPKLTNICEQADECWVIDPDAGSSVFFDRERATFFATLAHTRLFSTVNPGTEPFPEPVAESRQASGIKPEPDPFPAATPPRRGMIPRLKHLLRRWITYYVIKRAGVFDANYYRACYPEVKSRNLLKHFIDHGASEGKNPCAVFETAFYLGIYPDVNVHHVNPLYHYLQCGAGDLRSPCRDFDVGNFLRRCPRGVESGRSVLEYLATRN